MAAPPPPPAAALEQLSSTKMFGGHNLRFRHQSATLGCPMTFSVFLPASPVSNLPVLYWLSGLTCNDENFIIKSGAQRAAAAHGVALIAPDTSPRGLNLEGEADSWDFGVGKGCNYDNLVVPFAFYTIYQLGDFIGVYNLPHDLPLP